MKNILKDLKIGFDIGISVATNGVVKAKIKEELRERKLDRIRRIKVTMDRAFE